MADGASFGRVIAGHTRYRGCDGEARALGDEPTFYPDEYWDRFPDALERLPYTGPTSEVRGGGPFAKRTFTISNKAKPTPPPKPKTKPKRRRKVTSGDV
jgi:hypothetical protein